MIAPFVVVANPPSGAAAGGLGGTYPNPTVTKAASSFTVAGNVGFYGVAAVAKAAAWTQTFATVTRIVPNATSAAVAGTASTGVAPFGYTTAAQADAIPTAINAIRTDTDINKSLINSLINDLRTYGLEA